MKPILCVIAAALLVQLANEPTSSAYQLEPISRAFAPAGSRATQSFEIVNNGQDRVALTISFATLSRDEAYIETNHDADDEFLAYPSQMIVAAGKRQTVRVAWLGAPNPTRELAYRIIVTEVPIEVLDPRVPPAVEAAGVVKVLLNYRGTIFIRPANAAPKLSVDTAEVIAVKDHGLALAVTVTNSGTAVGLVKSCTARVTGRGGPAFDIPPADLAALRHTRLLAGGKRRYLIASPSTLTVGTVKVSGACSVEP
jgi:fimbrial chaperone protein